MSRLARIIARLGIALAVTLPAAAQTAQPPQPGLPVVGLGMTMPEYQGWGCLLGGTAGASGVFVYSDVIAVAATGVLNPALLIPVMATGFAVGCSVGAMASPAFLWLGRTFSGR